MNNKGKSEVVSKKSSSAFRWSLVTELSVKAIQPLSQIALAHLLAPEAFGIVATVTMITSFAEMLSDAGFQKYLVQHEFSSEQHLHNAANVAFWTNFIISIALWCLISIFNEPLSSVVGCRGYGSVLVAAGAVLPLNALCSIQLALFHRDFAFKQLLPVRLTYAITPLVVSVPLAILGFSFWSLIIGTIVSAIAYAVVITVKSSWRPKFWFRWSILLAMFSFSSWTLLESIAVWLTAWVGTFIAGIILNEYYLGLYKTSITMVNAGMAIISNAMIPVLFASLSRLKDDRDSFMSLLLNTQKKIAFITIPLGFGLFIFRDFATLILLGPQWAEASLLLGMWALSGSLVISFTFLCSEVYRALGRPKLSFISQVIYLLVMIPVMYFSAKEGFFQFALVSSLIRLSGIVIHAVILTKVIKINSIKLLTNLAPSIFSALIMSIFGWVMLSISNSITSTILWIVLSILIYLVTSFFDPAFRGVALSYYKEFFRKAR